MDERIAQRLSTSYMPEEIVKSPDENVYLHAYDVLSTGEAPARSRSMRHKAPILLAGLCILLAFMVFEAKKSPRPGVGHTKPPLGLSAVEPAAEPVLLLSVQTLGPNLILAWSGAPKTAKAAHITLFDGSAVTTWDLMPHYGTSGAVTCKRGSPNVQAVLFVDDGKRTFGSHASLLAKDATAPPTSEFGGPKRTLSASETAQIERLTRRNRRLEALVSVLRERMKTKKAGHGG